MPYEANFPSGYKKKKKKNSKFLAKLDFAILIYSLA